MTDYPKTVPERDMTDYLVPLTGLRDVLTARKPGLSLFIFDACRSIAANILPDDRPVEGVSKGMTPIKATVESVAIAFSSEFGRISKGREENGAMSYYTEALLSFLGEEGRDYEYVKRRTRIRVIQTTGGTQIPWTSDSNSAEIYLKPTAAIQELEKLVWQTRLATNDYDQIWSYTQEYPTSRFVKAAKRWLQQNRDPRGRASTKLSPQDLDRAFDQNRPTQSATVFRLDGPFGFKRIAAVKAAPKGQTTTLSPSLCRTIATTTLSPNQCRTIAAYDKIEVTKNISARAEPSEDSESRRMVLAGTTVDVTTVTSDDKGNFWLGFDEGGDAGYLPLNRVAVGETNVGLPLVEVKVGPAGSLESLVDEKPIRSAITDLKRVGRSISRVSVATSPAASKRLDVKLKGRVAHVFYLLRELGVKADQISSAIEVGESNPQRRDGDTGALGEQVRLRIFGH